MWLNMQGNNSTLIKVGKNRVGIIGLVSAIEAVAETCPEKSDSDIADELLECLSKKNYIHSSVRDNYKKAFLREYKKFFKLPYEEEESGEIVIRVLGQGCAQCDRLESDLLALLAELKIAADFEHVRDYLEIAKFGLMKMPALLINNQLVLSGRMVSKKKLKDKLLTSLGIEK